MQRYQDFILNSNGQGVSGAAVLVRPTGSTNAAALFSTNSGTASKTNPLTSASDGSFWFYGTNARYDLVISGAGIQTTTEVDVPLFDYTDVRYGGTAVPLISTASSLAIDLAAGSNFTHQVTQQTTLAQPSNPVIGQRGQVVFTQDGTTARTLGFHTFWKWAAGSTGTLSTATGSLAKTDVLRYSVISSTSAECEMRNAVS